MYWSTNKRDTIRGRYDFFIPSSATATATCKEEGRAKGARVDKVPLIIPYSSAPGVHAAAPRLGQIPPAYHCWVLSHGKTEGIKTRFPDPLALGSSNNLRAHPGLSHSHLSHCPFSQATCNNSQQHYLLPLPPFSSLFHHFAHPRLQIPTFLHVPHCILSWIDIIVCPALPCHAMLCWSSSGPATRGSDTHKSTLSILPPLTGAHQWPPCTIVFRKITSFWLLFSKVSQSHMGIILSSKSVHEKSLPRINVCGND